jgi:hypothetical protein
MLCYTYAIFHIPTGLKYYGVKYGLNANPEMFWQPGGYFTSSVHVKKLIKEYGAESFRVEIRKIFYDAKEAVRHEQTVLRRLKAIKKQDWLNQGYAAGPYIRRGNVSPETRAKMSVAKKGIPKSPEHREKLSARNKGKQHSSETRAKMSASQKKRILTEEQKINISLGKMGKKRKPFSEETKKRMSEGQKRRAANRVN